MKIEAYNQFIAFKPTKSTKKKISEGAEQIENVLQTFEQIQAEFFADLETWKSKFGIIFSFKNVIAKKIKIILLKRKRKLLKKGEGNASFGE